MTVDLATVNRTPASKRISRRAIVRETRAENPAILRQCYHGLVRDKFIKRLAMSTNQQIGFLSLPSFRRKVIIACYLVRMS